MPFVNPIRKHAGLISVLWLIIATVASAADVDVPIDQRSDREIRAASVRALEWIESHRASPEDGGLADMVDEGVSFRVFRFLSRTPSQRERFAGMFREQMASLNALAEFDGWVRQPHKSLIEHYHLVLAAHLTQLAGQTSPLTAVIQRQAQQALTTASYDNPTVRLTTALFLSRLDEPSAIDMGPLLAASLIEHISQDRHFIRLPGTDATEHQRHAATWLLYALVHEVVALTDFGHQPASPWLTARRSTVAGVLLEGLTWARAQDNRDLVAELAVTLYLLGEPLHAELQSALDDLVAKQQPDGSWGESTTTTRQNKVRHTVLTSTAALLAYLNWRQDPEKGQALQ